MKSSAQPLAAAGTSEPAIETLGWPAETRMRRVRQRATLLRFEKSEQLEKVFATEAASAIGHSIGTLS